MTQANSENVVSGVLSEAQVLGKVIPHPADLPAFARLQSILFEGDGNVPCAYFVLDEHQITPYVYLDVERAQTAAEGICGVVAAVPIVFDYRKTNQ